MEKTELNNNTIIKNISFDQSEILYNIMKLYNNGEPFECDITASELKFYKKNKKNKYEIPVPKILMDVYPQRDDIIKITPFQKLPLADNSVKSIVVDLPFVISPRDSKSKVENKEGSNLISNRFSSFYPADELYENIYWWINECYRVVKEDGIVVWKYQSTVSGGKSHWGVPFSFIVADKAGFYVEDEFILEASARLISATKYKEQQHARKYTSTFYVFRKNKKLANSCSCLKWLEFCENQNLEGKVWDNPRKNKELHKNTINTEKVKEPTYYEKIRQKVLSENKQEINDNSIKTYIEEPKVITTKTPSKIVQSDLNGNIIKEWNNYTEIITELGISSSSLSQCINGKTKSAGGFKWKKVFSI